MKSKFTILGCGSSLGSPWITNYSGNLKQSPKNLRTRCCAHIQKGNLSILIDTSPDIKYQLLKNKIKSLDAILYTHEHSDQTSGIFEMRPFFWKNKKKIRIYGSRRTIKELNSKYTFCFKKKYGYTPIMKSNVIGNKFSIKKKNSKILIKSFEVNHGLINATGYLIDKLAYIPDVLSIPIASWKELENLDILIIDALRRDPHPSHTHLEKTLHWLKKLDPKRAILTNLHNDLDYSELKKELPKNVEPAFDGLEVKLK